MRIAIDATPLRSEGARFPAATGGVARYTAQLVMALVREFPADEFVLVSDQPFALPCSAPNLRAGAKPGSILERRWWSFGLPRELRRMGADVFHGVSFAVPMPWTVPAVMTIHDLSPWSSDSWVDEAWRARTARVRRRVPWMLRSGAVRKVITPSEAIRKEVIRRLDVDPRRVTAIPLAAAMHMRPRASRNGRPYFLHVGMLEPRKNSAAVIAAWRQLRERFDVDLIIAGPQREEAAAIAGHPGLQMVGEVDEEELIQLYAGAIALVYPSLYEGFGLPVLEAMQCGTPVIISRDPALLETAGSAAISTDSIFDAMRSLVENPEYRCELRARSLERAALFSWQRTARETYQVYRDVLAA